MGRAQTPDALARVAGTLRAAGCVFAEDEAQLLISSAETVDELEWMVAQRVRGLPLEHIVGWVSFCGLRVAVDPGVFVPRQRTALVVREARSCPHATVVDLGCGSGAVGLAIGASELWSVDIDPAAVACARRNLDPQRVLLGDLYEPLPHHLRRRVDVIVANAPYVPTDAIGLMPAEARLHEHRVALDGGADGLDIVRRVVAGAPAWLAPHGHLLVETSRDQAPAVRDHMRRNGFEPTIVTDEDATVVKAYAR
ncbi:putative protein N(5)-glutamine methyltransferase [Allorhizocola rhizosphaerae]|uniref:putative protein N(5)-glutamine methyltransferase n=1 Tax=Allorhizocola rhizosphaerae TaxID=1872709 RepID=UPI001FE9E387|nr:putative protein N(5)-glutamine methyltransferase [Allorhizocola rhizosphaerae]